MPDLRALIGCWTLVVAHVLSGCQSQLVGPGPGAPASPPPLSVNPPAALSTPQPLGTGIPAASASRPEAAPHATDGLPRVPANAVLNVPRVADSPAVYHEVVAGETLSTIGTKYGLAADQLRRANGLDVGASLTPGQLVYIPGR